MGIEHWELSIGQIVCFLIRDRICEKLYLDGDGVRDTAAEATDAVGWNRAAGRAA